MSKKITQEHAAQLIKQTNGAIFAASFIKADGSLRNINGRLGVHANLKNKGLSYDPSTYDLLPVYDLQCCEYRMIRLNALKSVTVDGQCFKVV
jgi:hypothetical protein